MRLSTMKMSSWCFFSFVLGLVLCWMPEVEARGQTPDPKVKAATDELATATTKLKEAKQKANDAATALGSAKKLAADRDKKANDAAGLIAAANEANKIAHAALNAAKDAQMAADPADQPSFDDIINELQKRADNADGKLTEAVLQTKAAPYEKAAADMELLQTAFEDAAARGDLQGAQVGYNEAKKVAAKYGVRPAPPNGGKSGHHILPAPAMPCPIRKLCDASQTNADKIKRLTLRLEKDPCDVQSLLCRGDAYLFECLPTAAEADFRQVLQRCPDNMRALVGWGRAAAARHCWHAAIEHYNRAIAAGERAMQPASVQRRCDSHELGTYLYCATTGRAHSYLQLAKGHDAKTCELDTLLSEDNETVESRRLTHCEAALHDFTEAARYVPSEVDLSDLRACIDHAQECCEEHRSNLNNMKSSRAQAYQTASS